MDIVNRHYNPPLSAVDRVKQGIDFISDLLRSKGARREESASSAPPDSTTTNLSGGDLRDAWEVFGDYSQPKCRVETTLEIGYVDRDEKKTRRVIETRGIYIWDGSLAISAFCRLRNANRMFITKRIVSCVDLETGEVVRHVDDFLIERYRKSPHYSLDRLLADHSDAVTALFYFGKLSGALRSPKRAILRDFCRDIVRDSRITDESIDRLVNAMGIPSLASFRRIVGRLKEEPVILRVELFCCMVRMGMTSKTEYPAELDTLNYLMKRWNLYGIGVSEPNSNTHLDPHWKQIRRQCGQRSVRYLVGSKVRFTRCLCPARCAP